MSDLSILAKAKMEGIELSLAPDGTIRAIGAAEVLESLRPALRNNKPSIIEHLKLRAELAQFRFDLVEHDITDGAPAEELQRTNNLCWHLMQADGLAFDAAMRTSAKIVVACPPAAGEADYEDVEVLWQRIKEGA